MEMKITVEELRKSNIFVATPMYGGSCSGMYTKSTNDLSMLAMKYQVPLKFYYLFNESLITRARNYCVDEFMRSDSSHLVFIDSDIGFHPNDVFAMVALQMQDPENRNVVTAPYPKKNISWEKISKAVKMGFADENPFALENFVGDYVFNPATNNTSFRLDAPVEVMEAGTGFMCIPRKTFENYAAQFPEYMYTPDHIRTDAFDGSRQIMQYFQAEIDGANAAEQIVMPMLADAIESQDYSKLEEAYKTYTKAKEDSSNRYLSEDYLFCQNVRAMGMKVWMCPWMELKHMGSYIFGGSLSAMAAIQASPTASPESNQKHYTKGDKKESYLDKERKKKAAKKAARTSAAKKAAQTKEPVQTDLLSYEPKMGVKPVDITT